MIGNIANYLLGDFLKLQPRDQMKAGIVGIGITILVLSIVGSLIPPGHHPWWAYVLLAYPVQLLGVGLLVKGWKAWRKR